MIIILLCSIPPVAAGQDGEKPRDQQLDELRREVIQLRQEIAGLRTQLPLGDSTQSGELDQLEERLERRAEQLENKIDAVSRSVAPIAFNPKMVTAVNFAARSDNKEVIDPSPNQSVISNRPFLRTVEVELSSAVDPYASAFAVISLENQANKDFGIDAEEAYGLIKRLPVLESAPLGLKMKIGKYRASIGVDNKIHIHDLPWTTRPLIVSRYLGTDHGEFFESGFNPVGVDFDFYLPNPFPGTTFEMNADVVRAGDIAISNASLATSTLSPVAVRQPAYIGHLNLSKDWSNVHLLNIGASIYDEEGDYATRAYGVDLTYKWAPAEERESHSIVAGGEALMIDHINDALDRIHPYGWFGYLQYQTSYWLYLGARYDWIEESGDAGVVTRNIGLYASYYTTEFLRFRFGYEHRQSDIASQDNLNTIIFDLNLVFGSHPTEPYWVNR
ncbi:MAG: hypothetical protein E6K56_03930 [Ignavibacteria bacterium]|nr:MAG: hypothetical protein E6K56_03930 [Ignavibacteria bacterium]